MAEAADGQQAVALTAEHRPDIALIDIQMPGVDGIEATRQIVADERLDSVRVVILTNLGSTSTSSARCGQAQAAFAARAFNLTAN